MGDGFPSHYPLPLPQTASQMVGNGKIKFIVLHEKVQQSKLINIFTSFETHKTRPLL
jgi:hypothetical protein